MFCSTEEFLCEQFSRLNCVAMSVEMTTRKNVQVQVLVEKGFFRFRPIWKVFFDGNMMRRLATNVCGSPLTSTCILKIQARKRKTSPQ